MDSAAHKDIATADTLSGEFYRSEKVFKQVSEKIFARSWQWAADTDWIEDAKEMYPFTLLEGVLDEPLLLVNDGRRKHCLSNVCTHRGKILVEKPRRGGRISCGYHGRCFDLDGTFKSMPEFEETKNFPSERDHLTQINSQEWLGMIFVALDPDFEFSELVKPIEDRCDFLPLDKLHFKEKLSKTYYVKSNWALYVDNYLEGFHVPYIHPALKEQLSYKDYNYEVFKYCNLQIGVGKPGEPCFDLPESHPDYGKNIVAYYFWLYPNMMLNVYPWGVSFNYIQPLDHENTKVVFRTYQFEGTSFQFEDNNIDETELEDEEVVESVQKGIQSRFYKAGRYSPTMERCVHHFHALVKKAMER